MIETTKMVFIGTLHANLTPHHELQNSIKAHKPDILIIEIRQSDIQKKNTKQYPDEMQWALSRAQEKELPVYGFETETTQKNKKKAISKEENEEIIKKQKKILEHYTRQDCNRREISNMLDIPELKSITNPLEEKQREQKMAKNIQEIIKKNPHKKTIILTGVKHIQHFQQAFPGALFPFA